MPIRYKPTDPQGQQEAISRRRALAERLQQPEPVPQDPETPLTLAEMEKAHILWVYAKHQNKKKATVTELGWVGVISTLAYDGVPFLARGLWCCPDCSSIHGLRRLRSMRENCKPPKD